MKRMPTARFAIRLGAALAAGGVAACHPADDVRPAAVAATFALPPPAVCPASPATLPPVLKLPRTDAPKRVSKDGAGIDIAQIHTVNRPLQDVGVWTDAGNGWSVLTLQFGSERARSLAVRLHDVRLPKSATLWLCSVDGKLRTGPYLPKADGELWSESIAASQARVEVWTPTAQREQFSALLADVYGGYR